VRLFSLIMVCLWICLPASAHEVRPAYLELTQTAPGVHTVTWKQPVRDGRRLRLRPVFPETCQASPATLRAGTGAIIESWELVSCPLDSGQIVIEGLEFTLTDVFIRLIDQSGGIRTALLQPDHKQFDLTNAETGSFSEYFILGVEHIWFGYDHLLFVFAICLIVRRSQLFMTITAFTVAHSLTLGLAVLGGISLPGPPVEAVIALSLVLLAREALIQKQSRPGLTSQMPGLIAFAFGLLHGFGFAGALAQIGLPDDARFAALFLFNLGVEAGQILFIAVLLGLAALLTRLQRPLAMAVSGAPAYFIGIAGTFWTFERLAQF